MKLGGVQWTTLVDYPGRVAATLFAAGCNFRCPYCHNPELVLPQRIPGLPWVPIDQLLEDLAERRGFLDGVVLSGGEPTLQPELGELIQTIKEMGYAVKLDTNGSRPDVLETVLTRGWVDFVAMDVKAPPALYERVAGVPVDKEKIERSIDVIRRLAPSYEFRTTAAPGLTMKDLRETGERLAPAAAYWLQAFHVPPEKPLLDNACLDQPYLNRESLEAVWGTLREAFASGGVRG